ncbi:hypothetical protein MAR_023611, partial [Mya arenaria]
MDRYTNKEHGSMIVSRNQAMTEVEVRREYPRFEAVHQYIHHLELTNDREGLVSEVLISHLPQNICLQDFVFVLKECGYTELAAELLRSLDAATTLKHVHRSTSGQRPSVSKMNFILKKMVDDAQFNNPRINLRHIRKGLRLKMQNESDKDRIQILNDKCIVFIGAEIDAIAITFDEGLCEGAVFTEMKSLTSATNYLDKMNTLTQSQHTDTRKGEERETK